MTATVARDAVEVGAVNYQYTAHDRWCELPIDCEVAAVATDSHDRVYLFSRSDLPIRVFDAMGNSLGGWGDGQFIGPHGICIGSDDAMYCTDYLNHTIRKFSLEGELLLTLGTAGAGSDTGATGVDYRDVVRPGPPFNFPTNVAASPSGEIYVADGYGNARIHVFSPAGKLLKSWGAPGAGPGEFAVPHGIALDSQERVYVADRENSRIQIFSKGGAFLDQWRDVARPCQIYVDRYDVVFVAELGFRAGMFPGNEPPTARATGGRVSVFSNDGDLLSRWGGGERPCEPGDFFAPHDICVDSRGDIYVAEVAYTAGVSRGVVGPDCHTLQKFVRRNFP